MTMVTLTHIYYLIGVVLVGAAVLNALDRRWSVAAFWAILTVPFLVGDQILAAAKAGTRWPAQAMGVGVIALAILASLSRRRASDDEREAAAREASAAKLGNRLFVPALAIPVLTLVFYFAAKYVPWGSHVWMDPLQQPLISFGLAVVGALIVALIITRSHPAHGLTEGRRLLDSLGWAALLPMMLATLGTVFAQTGVGDAVTRLVSAAIPVESRLACMLAYGLGMVMFTMIMGNAFAAFPVMMGGIGLPLLIGRHGADAASLGAIGMVTGYCGTLLTPMAANYNIVPVILLELRSEYSVIRAQWPTALVLMATNLVLMYFIVFR
jgi:uncharacterized membrane protein